MPSKLESAVSLDWYVVDERCVTVTFVKHLHPTLSAEERAEQRMAPTLQDAFAMFAKPEKLAPEDAWYCSNCKKHQVCVACVDMRVICE